MNSHVSSEQTSRRPAPSEPSLGSTSARSDADDIRRDGFAETLSQLSREVASLKDTFALPASQAGCEAAKRMRNMSDAVASQVGDAASGVADTGSISGLCAETPSSGSFWRASLRRQKSRSQTRTGQVDRKGARVSELEKGRLTARVRGRVRGGESGLVSFDALGSSKREKIFS